MSSPILEVSGEHRHFVEFRWGADYFLNVKTKDNNIHHAYYKRLAALIFLAFSLEALLNHVGAKKFPGWWQEVERLDVEKKLKLLSAHLGIEVKFGEPPYQVLIDLIRRRNNIAHSKYRVYTSQQVELRGDIDHLVQDRVEQMLRREDFEDNDYLDRVLSNLSVATEQILSAAGLSKDNKASFKGIVKVTTGKSKPK